MVDSENTPAYTKQSVDEIVELLAQLRHHTGTSHWTAQIQKLAGIEMSLPMFMVLVSLHRSGSQRVSDLARMLELDISTTSRHVQHLGERGLINQVPDPTDGRASMMELTLRGEDVFARIHEARLAFLRRLLASWNQKDQEDLVRLFRKFVQSIIREKEQTV
ncbi:MAG: MarR family winged helix-turn-helix transcriptional regulator [Candidatus Dormibacteria bacterium]